MLFDHPVQIGMHVRLEDRGGDLGVPVRAERVADVVDECAEHVLVGTAGALGAGGGLQAVGQPVDGEAAVIAVEQPQMREDAIRQLAPRPRRCARR